AGPHHYDVGLDDIIDVVYAAAPAGIVLEAANPRHAHEWTVFESSPLPEGKTLIAGVIDSTTNYIEHPDLISQRLRQFAAVVGRDRLMGGVDCGFGGSTRWLLDGDIFWAKLASLVEGARRASAALWP